MICIKINIYCILSISDKFVDGYKVWNLGEKILVVEL